MLVKSNTFPFIILGYIENFYLAYQSLFSSSLKQTKRIPHLFNIYFVQSLFRIINFRLGKADEEDQQEILKEHVVKWLGQPKLENTCALNNRVYSRLSLPDV